MDKPKVFFDLNVLVSASARVGIPRECLNLALHGKVFGATAEHCLVRLSEILQKKFRLSKELAEQAQATLSLVIESVPQPEKVPAVTGDAEDDIILASAVSWQADYLVSGDKQHLLPLKVYQGIPILSPRDLFEALTAETSSPQSDKPDSR